MAIKLEINGNYFPPDDDKEKIHGVKIGDDAGIAWSDTTNEVRIIRYKDLNKKRYDLLETLQISEGKEAFREIIFRQDNQISKINIIIRNK